MSTILVTGGLGFIGSHLVDKLIELGHEVDVVDDLSTGSMDNSNRDVRRYYIMDVVDFCRDTDVCERYDMVFHLANCSRIARSFDEPVKTLTNNFMSTIGIVEYIRRTGSGHLFYASSSTTEFTDRLNNPYTLSKFMCDDTLELYAKYFGLRYSLVKFYNAYGSMREADLGKDTTVICKFKRQIYADQPLTVIGTGEKRRDFTYIGDTVTALAILTMVKDHERAYHIGTGKNYSINEVAAAFNHHVKYVPDREYELAETLCTKRNVPGWEPTVDVIEHIKQWREANGPS